jgi:pimeloyl-ACP methyl ester carboxylesterase
VIGEFPVAELLVRGRRLGYEMAPEDGDPEAVSLVFIHGTGGDRQDWRAQLDGLSTVATVVALELPGHGKSDPPGEATVPAYAEWVSELIERLGLKRVILAGCSLGSAITLWLALNPPLWLIGIGLVGAGARLRVHPSLLDGLLEDKAKAASLLADYCFSSATGEELRRTVDEKYIDQPTELLHGDLAACNQFDVIQRLGEIALPTCIIVGEDDRLTPVKYSTLLHEAIGGSLLHVIPRAGHLVMIEQPEAFNRAVSTFVMNTFGAD